MNPARRAWVHLGAAERVIFVACFPLVLIAWASIWIICGAYGPREER